MIVENLPDDSIKAIRRVQGEFRPSRWSTVGNQIAGAFCIVFPLWVALLIYGSHRSAQSFRLDSAPGIKLVIGSLVLLIVGVLLWRRAGRWVRFGSGEVQLMSRSGTPVWSENLLTLERGAIGDSHRINPTLLLYWGETQRQLPLYPALAEAIKALEPPAPAESEAIDLSEAVSSAEPAGPAWNCPKCGEENPGNFNECWNCLMARPIPFSGPAGRRPSSGSVVPR
jgi:hypothetical protein